MNKIIIIGGGLLSKQILEKLFNSKREIYDSICGVIDDFKEINSCVFNDIKVIDNIKSFKENYNVHNFNFFPAIGYNNLFKRNQLLNHFKKIGAQFINIILSENIYFKNIGTGNFFSYNSCLDNVNFIGDFNFIDISVSVGEYTKIYNGNYFSNNATICGNVEIRNSNFLGANCTITDNIKIDSNNFVNAGALLNKNLDNDTKYCEHRKYFFDKTN